MIEPDLDLWPWNASKGTGPQGTLKEVLTRLWLVTTCTIFGIGNIELGEEHRKKKEREELKLLGKNTDTIVFVRKLYFTQVVV